MRIQSLILGLALTLASVFSEGHPVSFKDGFGLMSYNSKDMNEILLTYSFNPHFAASGFYLRTEKSEFYIPRANFLLKRWNNDDSQGNLYFSAGSGYEKFNSDSKPAHLAEVVADWESRSYYTLIEHRYLKRQNDLNLNLPSGDDNHTKLRLGFAPFLADYSDLNIWYITEFNRHNDATQIEATQFLRFYIKNVLWEVGAGFDGSVAFNFMFHL